MSSNFDNTYKQARAIKTGSHKLAPEHQEIVNWTAKQFGVKALDFNLDIKQKSVGHKQQIVTVILETVDECKRINTVENRNLIIPKIRNLIITMSADLRKSDLTKCRTLLPDNAGNYQEMIVEFDALESYELGNAYTHFTAELETLRNQYPNDIWTISNNSGHYTIFYFTEAQIKNNAEELSNTIVAALHAALLKHDEFNYFPDHKLSIRFDSKEVFDSDYGSWHSYYQ